MTRLLVSLWIALRALMENKVRSALTLGGTAQVVFGNQNWSTLVAGTTPEVLEIKEWPLFSDRPFT
jgi:putative ABC transport system permease protein